MALLIGLLASPSAAAPATGASAPAASPAAEGIDPRVYAGTDPLSRSILQGGTISAVRDPKDGGKVLYIRRGAMEKDARDALAPATGDVSLPQSRVSAKKDVRPKKAKKGSPRVGLEGQAPKQLNGMGEQLDAASKDGRAGTADGARAASERLWGDFRPEK